MQCKACGHKHKWVDPNAEVYERLYEDTEDFIKIVGNFTIKKEFEYGLREVYLFACPNCGTVRMEEY